MIVGRTLAAVTALVVLATAAALCVITAGLALFWVLEPVVGRAGAAALLAGLSGLIVAIAVVAVNTRPHSGHGHGHHAEAGHDYSGLVDRVMEMARDRPILAIGAALAAGVIVIRNPALVATLAAAFMQPRKPD